MSLLLALLATVVVVTAVLTALFQEVISAIATFAIFSLGLAVLWLLFAAPDVALAEAAVGAGVLSVLLLLVAVRTSPGMPGIPDAGWFRRPTVCGLVVAGGLVAVLAATIPTLPPADDHTTPAVSQTYADGSLTPYGYYLQETEVVPEVTNAVVAILIIYRPIDTFGEIVVIVAALVGALLVLELEGLP